MKIEISRQASELFGGAFILSNGNQGYTLGCENRANKLLQLDLGIGKMLMGYSDAGEPVPLPEDVPTFWVTAPTEVKTGVGVIVNADWAIDSGRANLHNSDANREMANEMAKELYNVLCKSWTYFQQRQEEETEEQHNRRIYAFYNGLWNVFTNFRGNEANGVQRWNGVELGVSLLKMIVWGDGPDDTWGYRKSLKEGKAVVPTGIKDGELCAFKDIKYVVDQSVLRPEVKAQFLGEGGQNAVTENIFRMPNEVLTLKQDVQPLGWRQVFENALRVHEILTPDLANGEFGRVFSSILNGFTDGGNEPAPEEQRAAEKRVAEVKDILRKFKFYSQVEQSVATADNLLAPDIHDSDQEAEKMKVDFTPASVHLSEDYDEIGLSVFKCCRNPRGGIGQDRLAKFAKDAENDDKRKAVLKYLSSDDCGEVFYQTLKKIGTNSWLADLRKRSRFEELAKGLSAKQQLIIAARLGLEVEWDLAGTAEKDDLTNAATDNNRLYTKEWLDACLKLEMLEETGVADDSSRKGEREASVTFKKMSPVDGQDNMYELSETEDPIPAWFSEEVNQSLTIQLVRGRLISTVIESMSVRQYKIRARIKLPDNDKAEIKNGNVISATTRATRPKFLLEALRERYEELGLAGDYNFKDNLPNDMEFVFGPPGTGKTTWLAKKLINLVKAEGARPHILVLTPTNKAADVLVSRVIKEMEMDQDSSYQNWLRRFGISLDLELEDDRVLCGKQFDLNEGQPLVVATTMIRFAYDEVLGKGPLREMGWDYIVIDEASMISLIQMLYPLTKKKNAAKFIIAGDPHQIAPVVRAEPLIDQNIYKMIKLTRFEKHDYELEVSKSVGARYKVHCLTTQYRSIPAIGQVFGEFCYDGNLKHNRQGEGASIKVADGCEIRPLTILRFPVYRVEGVYKVRTIGWSSYHVYSALFIFEFIRKLISDGGELRNKLGNEKFSIGIISPYRIQADIVAKMFDQEKNAKKIPENISIQASTVHGFQGDECDMIVALLNPPRGMGSPRRLKNGGTVPSTINNRNILNVAMSRARDYLVVAMPEENSKNYDRLSGPTQIVDVIRENLYVEHSMRDLEEKVWGDKEFIECNTFQTGHQSVNVYVPQTMRFEVRAEASAIDIQFTDDDKFVKKSGKAFESSAKREGKEDDAINNRTIPDGFESANKYQFVEPGWYYYLKTDDPKTMKEPHHCEDWEQSRQIDMREVWVIKKGGNNGNS